ncbi:MFS transporter [Kitasatospora camelliae]|uniref:MFS transporter n=1 Tax=Kitasatospora camelliae TaxID=3156397 RepID=A0AAU8K4B0_9ACTN
MPASVSARWRTYRGLSPSLKALVVLSFVVALGSYMITPFIGVLLVKGVGLAVGPAGALVAVATFIQFGGSIAGGPVVDRLGLKRTMVAALALRTSGLVLLALAVRVPALVLPAVVLVAAGPALYLPANKAYIVSCVREDLRPLFLAISSAALNAGMGLGPFLAALLIDRDPVLLLLGLAALFALITVAHQVATRPVERRPAPAPGTPTGPTGLRSLRGVLRPVLFNGLAFYLYFFFQSFIGLYAAGLSDLRVLGWVMLLNCAMVVVLQPPLAGWIARTGYRGLLTGSFLLMAAGTAVMARGGTPALLLGTVLFTLGEVLVFLRGDLEVVGRMSDRPASAFGVQRLTTGVGGFLAGLVGGVVFAHYEKAGHPGMFWNAVAAQAVLAAGLALAFGGSTRRRTAGPPVGDGPPATAPVPAVPTPAAPTHTDRPVESEAVS